MWRMDLALFFFSFCAILLGCELFTNGVEWAGRRFGLAAGAVGGLLAAVGTAMPETILPLVAILLIGGGVGRDIGTGSILGSPFTLSTLAVFFYGLAAATVGPGRKAGVIPFDGPMVRRMPGFFILAYSLAALAAFLPTDYGAVKPVIAVVLGVIYLIFIYEMLKAKQIGIKDRLKPLYFQTIARGIPGFSTGLPPTALIVAQVLIGLAAIAGGADVFMGRLEGIALAIGVSPLVLSLLVSPMATELPEIANSVIWARQGKDVFALGNILGSMVYQSCILAIIGIALTPWHVNPSDPAQLPQTASIGLALASSALLSVHLRGGAIRISGLLAAGLFYLALIALMLLGL